MFDFLDKDWFVISLELFLLLFIIYDTKKYFETKKREYLTNILFTIGFFIWTAIPFYNSYVTWDDAKKQEILLSLSQENNETLAACMSDKLFKEESFQSYQDRDKNSSKHQEFLKEIREDCLDDGWF